MNFVSGTGYELVSSLLNTEMNCIFNSSAIKNPRIIIFPALSYSGNKPYPGISRRLRELSSHMPVMSFVQADVSHCGAQTDGEARGPSSDVTIFKRTASQLDQATAAP